MGDLPVEYSESLTVESVMKHIGGGEEIEKHVVRKVVAARLEGKTKVWYTFTGAVLTRMVFR